MGTVVVKGLIGSSRALFLSYLNLNRIWPWAHRHRRQCCCCAYSCHWSCHCCQWAQSGHDCDDDDDRHYLPDVAADAPVRSDAALWASRDWVNGCQPDRSLCWCDSIWSADDPGRSVNWQTRPISRVPASVHLSVSRGDSPPRVSWHWIREEEERNCELNYNIEMRKVNLAQTSHKSQLALSINQLLANQFDKHIAHKRCVKVRAD